jgi:hypothetical protein
MYYSIIIIQELVSNHSSVRKLENEYCHSKVMIYNETYLSIVNKDQ